jgi:uncharacterized protein (UPF0262 family)
MTYFTDYINNSNIKAIATATATTAKDIFVMFMMREGFLNNDAAAEFDLIEGKTEAEYMTARRTGLMAIGGRAARKNIFATYENALNHSTFVA